MTDEELKQQAVRRGVADIWATFLASLVCAGRLTVSDAALKLAEVADEGGFVAELKTLARPHPPDDTPPIDCLR